MQLFVEHLTVIDAAYLHPEHGIVGESWIVDATLHGDLDPQSMVMDFAHVKKQLKAAIDGSLDHTLIVPEASQMLQIGHDAAHCTLTYRFGANEQLIHHSPLQAVSLLPLREISNAALETWLEHDLMRVVPANVSHVEIDLRHEDPAPAYFHYAHGLKKHDGNCQRIAHGHRSRLMIWENGERSEKLERHWTDAWKFAYLATETDRVRMQDGLSEFAYTSPQGNFRLSYPSARCHLMATDSTIECIAQHIAQQLKARNPAATYQVRAYEGVHKGAIAQA